MTVLILHANLNNMTGTRKETQKHSYDYMNVERLYSRAATCSKKGRKAAKALASGPLAIPAPEIYPKLTETETGFTWYSLIKLWAFCFVAHES